MHWITLTLIASFFFAIQNIIDKKISDETRDTMTGLFLMKVSTVPAIIFLWIWCYPEIYITPYIFVLAVFIGLIATASGFLYLKVFQYGDASTIMPMYELGPIWSLILGYIFLGELPRHNEYLAMIFLIMGALIFSIQRPKSGKIMGKGLLNITFFLVLITSLLYNLQYALSKLVIEESNIQTVFTITQTIYLFLSITIAYISTRGRVLMDMKALSKKFILLAVLGEGLGIIAYIIYTTAFTTGSLALTNALLSTQSIFVILLGYFLTRYTPSFLNEQWDIKTTIQKGLGIILIATGVIIMYYIN